MIQEARQKYYYPCIAKYIKKWVINCQVCIQTKRINNDLLRTELPNCPEWDLGPEDILQMEILPILPPSRGYDHTITAIDVFSRYLFAYPVLLQQRYQESTWIYYASTPTFQQR